MCVCVCVQTYVCMTIFFLNSFIYNEITLKFFSVEKLIILLKGYYVTSIFARCYEISLIINIRN